MTFSISAVITTGKSLTFLCRDPSPGPGTARTSRPGRVLLRVAGFFLLEQIASSVVGGPAAEENSEQIWRFETMLKNIRKVYVNRRTLVVSLPADAAEFAGIQRGDLVRVQVDQARRITLAKLDLDAASPRMKNRKERKK